MPGMSMLRFALVTATLLAGSAAHAGKQAENRASGAIPAPGKQAGSGARGTPQGPRHGFPDNDGIRRAIEVANEHARFRRNDSEG